MGEPGRPQKFTPEEVANALRLKRGLIYPTSKALGCTPKTVRVYIKRYASVREVLEEQRERLIDSAELRLIDAVEGRAEPWAVAMVLKTLGRNRGYVERDERSLVNADGDSIDLDKPVEVHYHVHSLDDGPDDEDAAYDPAADAEPLQ